jgi:hypothetical protein
LASSALEDPQLHTYSRGAEIFATAADKFGLYVSDDQSNEWQAMLAACRNLDDILDGQAPQVEREESYDAEVARLFMAPLDNADAQYNGLTSNMQALARDWSAEKTTRVIDATMAIKEIALTRRMAFHPHALGRLALFEGVQTARLFEIENQTGTEDRFNQWLQVLMQVGIVVDSAVDLAQDFGNRLTRVEPTKANQLRILRFAVPRIRQLVATTPNSLYLPLFNATRAVVDDSKKDSLRKEFATSG